MFTFDFIFENAKFDYTCYVTQTVYFLSSPFGGKPIEISKGQFEQYCAEHKDEL